jgi:putative flavoprotein involved in K+ transport
MSLMNTTVIDTGGYKQAILNDNPENKSMYKNFIEEGVVWEDGRKEIVDSIIYATGFRPNVNYLSSLTNAIDQFGNPTHIKGVSNTIDGLYYIGLSGQRSFSSATIRGVGGDANYVVKKISKFS